MPTCSLPLLAVLLNYVEYFQDSEENTYWKHILHLCKEEPAIKCGRHTKVGEHENGERDQSRQEDDEKEGR